MTDTTSANSGKILVIDDEPSIVAYLMAVLEDEGYETCSATDAEAGLVLARREAPSLITLDIMMPRRSGIALYQDLKLDSALQCIPVIFVSAFSRTNDFRPASFRKMVPDERVPVPEAYVEKPINVSEFLEIVADLIQAGARGVSSGGEAAS